MRKCLTPLLVIAFICSASLVIAQPPDKEKLTLRAQMLHEKILRLRTEIAVKVEEHNKAVNEFKAIIQLLEQMEKETKS